MSGITIIMLLPLLVIIIAVPLLVGVYVYRDASSRGRNAVLWTLLAVLAPSLIGFIIYLLVRGSYSNLKCRVCGERLREGYMVCPGCGAKLRPSCPNCSAPVEPDWKLCPRCAAPLPEQQTDIAAPVKKKDRTLPVILAAVILVPLVLILLSVAAFTTESTMSSATALLSVDDYIQETGNTQIREWLSKKKPADNQAAVLRYEIDTDDETVTQYLIYIPSLSESAEYTVESGSGFFGDSIDVDISDKGEGSDALMSISFTSGDAVDISITCEGEKMQCEIEDVKEPLD